MNKFSTYVFVLVVLFYNCNGIILASQIDCLAPLSNEKYLHHFLEEKSSTLQDNAPPVISLIDNLNDKNFAVVKATKNHFFGYDRVNSNYFINAIMEKGIIRFYLKTRTLDKNGVELDRSTLSGQAIFDHMMTHFNKSNQNHVNLYRRLSPVKGIEFEWDSETDMKIFNGLKPHERINESYLKSSWFGRQAFRWGIYHAGKTTFQFNSEGAYTSVKATFYKFRRDMPKLERVKRYFRKINNLFAPSA